ncbi:hypothetical protein [Glycomyces terrestris]|uniref:Protein ImuA n=1 Tax=Glycomyces terrestris TaxID=2493553 RepID=A0A426UWC7_9ACTN|nr:hypothetical protein [Glycomyces terrestris]RRR98499.1 hypothetical protein EIW28_16610 [Glycomyces terrestris]
MATTVAAALAAELGLRTAADLRSTAAAPAAGLRPAAAPGEPGQGESRRQAAVGPPKTILPVTSDISGLLPHGGLATVTAITATRRGATSLLWRLLAGPTGAGAWCALVGLPNLYPLAATAAGVDLGRVALVDPGSLIAEAAGALAEGVAAIVVPSEALSPAQARRLTARARGSGTSIIWWETRPVAGADARLQVARAHWKGLRANTGRRWGAGRLAACELEVASRWRSGGVRRASVWPYGGRPPEHVLDLRDRPAEPPRGDRRAEDAADEPRVVPSGEPRTAERAPASPAGPGHPAEVGTAVVDLRAHAVAPGRERPAAEAAGPRPAGGERR